MREKKEEGVLGKLDKKKKQKREALFGAAFSLFTSKGIQDTSISDIVKMADMAKGTFYLYFKDKYDLRDKLIVAKTMELFQKAEVESTTQKLPSLEEQVIFIADSVINQLDEDKQLLEFISKNLSWGVFHHVLLTETTEAGGYSFYDRYCELIQESGRTFRNPELMLYMVVELINSTCHNVILMQEPVTLTELKPDLYGVIRDIIRRMER
ncbi:MAG: TetR/AcrR family transcriptional regulator [Lachnospiraceae bacterium]|nr:TetR/AcrR family transcriptional regulator [Lachnospiraceae bacterium]